MLASHDENPIDDDELLTGTGSGGVFTSGYLQDKPLVEYLDDTERVAFLLSNKKKGLRRESDRENTAFRPGDNYQAIAAVTDQRVLFVIGDAEGDGDSQFAVPYTEIEDVKTGRSVLTKHLDVWTTEGVRWRFSVRSTVDLEPAAAYVDSAAVVWSRVESKLRDARKHIADIETSADDCDHEAAQAAADEARSHIEEARRVAPDLTEDRNNAIWERIEWTQEKLDYSRIASHRSRARDFVTEAESQWRKESYNKAYESYEQAREEYETALRIASEHQYDEREEVLDALDRVNQNIDHLSKSPLRRAEQTRNRAAAIDDADIAADLWEDALEKYQTALVLDWGNDNQRFAGDKDEITAEIEHCVDRIQYTRTELADRHRTTGDWYVQSQQYQRARDQYLIALTHLEQGLSIAEELLPSVPEAIRTAHEQLEALVEQTQRKAGDEVFDFVGDIETDEVETPRQTPEAGPPDPTDVDRERLRASLLTLDPAAFRAVVARTWESMGFETTRLTDAEEVIDVIASKEHPVPEKHLLVTERCQENIRFKRETIEQSTAVRSEDRDVDVLTFVTTGSFTDGAKDAAIEHSMKLVGLDRLLDILEAEGIREMPAETGEPAAE